MKKLLLILNPNAGLQKARKLLADTVAIFAKYGYLSTVCVTAKRGDGTEFAQHLAGEHDLVVASGGDGTLNETITGLMRGGHAVPLGYIPAGSTNDFASSLGLSSDILRAARDIMEGCPQPLDIGRFRNRYFSYTASFGAFTSTSYSTPQNVKNVLGHAAYVLEGIKDLPNIRPQTVCLEADGQSYEGEYLFGAVCNSTSLGGVLKLAPDMVDMNDGLFETLLIRNPGNAIELQSILTALTARKYDNPMLTFVRASKLVFQADPNMPWTLDGEYAEGAREITVENIRSAITLMVPEKKDE